MSKHFGTLATLGLAFLVTACGGNGGGGGTPATSGDANSTASDSSATQPAEGTWSGTNSLGNTFDMLLLENGDLYQIYGSTATDGTFTALGLSQGQYTSTGSTVSAPFTQYNYVGAKLGGSLNATLVPGTSITGTATSNSGGATVSFAAMPTSQSHPGYQYNTPARVADIAGAWGTGYLLGQSTPLVFTIDAAGALSGSNLGCSFTGQVQPRATGKNVFDASLHFGQSPCVAPGTTLAGVGLSYTTSGGKRQLILALLDAARANGTLLYGQR